MRSAFPFSPARYEQQLAAILERIQEADGLDEVSLQQILRAFPKDGRGFFSKSELVRGYRHLREREGLELRIPETELLERLRMKPVRTLSGVAPVTVLTKPYPCPGRCIFCPSDVRMPKSYLSDEPGAQRAAEHQFDPYRQTLARLLSYHHTGHVTDKVELIILGGTWSFYPESYQIWFVARCFEAMRDFAAGTRELPEVEFETDFRRLRRRLDGRCERDLYNRVVSDYAPAAARESVSWDELAALQRANESAPVRCVGLVVETRPDRIDEQEVERIRRLGATKVQIGYQSLDDEVLLRNRRGHDVAATRRAMRLLRLAGFKIHAHWMPNLYGSTPQRDVEDFRRIFEDPALRPDELKIYPCSLIESAELMAYYADGRWRPYDHDELLEVLTTCLLQVPEYCRVTRVVRDIPGGDIVAGNRTTNFRQVAERELRRRGERPRDIRAREVRGRRVRADAGTLRSTEYRTHTGRERFLQFVDEQAPADGRCLLAFARLGLPQERPFVAELEGCALLREVHVYGRVVGFGRKVAGGAQHLGLGERLVRAAAREARRAGYQRLAVISSVGTRDYYRRLGFRDGRLYQHLELGAEV